MIPDSIGAFTRDQVNGFIGVIVPAESVNVAPAFGGLLAEVTVQLGERVDFGQVVALLSDRPIRDELLIVQAALATAEASVVQSKVSKEETLEKLSMERSLSESGSTSRRHVLEADAAHQRAKAALAVSKAKVEEQKARFAKLQRQRREVRLVAPFSGTVALRYLDPGVVVQAGEPIVRVITSDDLRVRFAVPPDHIGRLAAGDRVLFRIEAQGRTIRAVVRQVAPEVDPISQLVFAEAQLEVDPDLIGLIQVGLVGRILIPEASHENKRN